MMVTTAVIEKMGNFVVVSAPRSIIMSQSKKLYILVCFLLDEIVNI